MDKKEYEQVEFATLCGMIFDIFSEQIGKHFEAKQHKAKVKAAKEALDKLYQAAAVECGR